MPFRRKCDDELPPQKPVKIPYQRGPLGPVRPALMGLRPEAVVPFSESDPEGETRGQISRERMRAAKAEQMMLPTEPRIAVDENDVTEGWEWEWDGT